MPLEIPIVDFGTVSTADEGWVPVLFKMPLPGAPILIPFIEYREGLPVLVPYEAVKKVVEFTKVSLPTIEIPRVPLPALKEKYGIQFRENCEDRWDRYMPSFLSVAKSPFCSISYYWGRIVGGALEFFWKELVEKQVDKIQDNINSVFTNFHYELDRALDKIVGDSVDNLNESLGWMETQLEDSVKQSIDKLYEATGLKPGMLMSVPQIKNITPAGFEYYSLGPSTLHYFAIATLVRL